MLFSVRSRRFFAAHIPRAVFASLLARTVAWNTELNAFYAWLDNEKATMLREYRDCRKDSPDRHEQLVKVLRQRNRHLHIVLDEFIARSDREEAALGRDDALTQICSFFTHEICKEAERRGVEAVVADVYD